MGKIHTVMHVRLIYAMYMHDRTQTPRHVVCNPVTKSFHQIPAPKLCCEYRHDFVVMLVENTMQRYRIITMEYSYHGSGRGSEEVHLYDSTCRAWKKLCKVPTKHFVCSCVFLEGIFYTLLETTIQKSQYNNLYMCDLETGTWSYIDHVKLHQPPSYRLEQKSSSQLVVSMDRLFFVKYSTLAWEMVITVSIWEILLGEKEVIKAAEVPKFLSYDKNMVVHLEQVMGNPMVALRCGDSVIISSLLGRCVRWNLVKNCWYELPPILPMHDPVYLCGAACHGLYAARFNLNLRVMSLDEQ